MKKLFKMFLSLSLIVTVIYSVTNVSATSDILTKQENYYVYNALNAGYSSKRSDVLTPTYYIFAGKQDLLSANQLVEELSMIDNVNTWAGSVYVINPISDKYDENDLVKFEELVKVAPIKNVKVIGIDSGATFVNDYLSQRSNYIAGMLLINGEMNITPTNSNSLPVYLVNPSENVVNYYQGLNDTNKNSETSQYRLSVNSDNELQRVVVANGVQTYKEAFGNAWNSVFSKNYRYHNSIGEFYNLPILNSKMDVLALDFDLVQVPLFNELNMQYNEMVHQTVSNMPGSNYAWFEYIPKQTLDSKDKSVPLVVTIHGNQNDPRLQGDTSGWSELAAKENFMVVSPEYQTASENAYFTQPGNTNIYGVVAGLKADGIINLIKDLQVKYPQIDPSKIYVTGLSQGGAMTSLLGIKNSDVFAAAAPVSGVNVFNSQIQELIKDYKGNETAYLYLCGNHDWFQMIPVNGQGSLGVSSLLNIPLWKEGSATDIFPAIQAYQQINNLTVSTKDMSINPYYGIKLDNQKWSKLGNKDMLEGTLSNDKGVVMKLAAIKDLAHWNYKPEAAYIWNFFKNYQRNIKTGELIYLENVKEEKPVINQPTISVATGDNSNIVILTSIALISMLVFARKIKEN